MYIATPSAGQQTVSAAATGRTLLTPVELSAGDNFTCARFSNARIKCWGRNNLGQLGYGDTATRGSNISEMGDNLPYVNLGTGRTAKKVVAGSYFACAILDNDTVKCWGSNESGQLGLGDTEKRGDDPNEMGDNLPTVQLGTGRTAKNLAVAFGSVCALLDTNNIKCWGENGSGQLGLGDRNNRGDTANEMGNYLPIVQLGTGLSVVSIGAGRTMTCALLSNNAVKCWGEIVYGRGSVEYGIGFSEDQMGDNLVPISFGTDKTVTELFQGPGSACVFLDDETSKCWGDNSKGVLGNGNTDNLGDNADEIGDALPVVNFGSDPATSYSNNGAWYAYTTRCAILASGNLKCWGFNEYGQLGLGDDANRITSPHLLSAIDLGTGRTVSSISVGYGHVCAILDNATVKCWGYNLVGNLGYGDSVNRGDKPGQMGDALGTISLGTEGYGLPTVTATASNTYTPTATRVPMTPTPRLRAGGNSTCLLDSRGSLRCYGYNTSGQLGYGNTTNYGDETTRAAPILPIVDVSATNTIVDVQVGTDHTCALLDNGTVKCWGNGGSGKLGTESTTNLGDNPGEMGAALNTIALPSGRTAVSIATGDRNTCALLDNNALACWGNPIGTSDNIQHGSTSNTMGDSLPQLSVSSSHTITAFAVGDLFACVILDNATLKCFGSNLSGNLGVPASTSSLGAEGDMGDTLPTVNLGTDVSVRAITLGKYHVCAIVNTGQVKCWGYNQYGQLGNGSTANLGDDAGEMGDNLPFVNLGSGRTATVISAGANHTCAILDNNTLKCWGYNGYGQLGQGTGTTRGDNPGEMGDALAAVNFGSTTTISRVVVGEQHTCVMFVDYTVRCFGRGGYGQLGYGNSDNKGDDPAHMGLALPSYSVETIYQPTATNTPTPLATATAVPSATFTASTTRTASKTATPTKTLTPSKTLTRSLTATQTRSLTPTKIATLTASVTRTKPPTLRPSSTRTRTKLLSPTKSPTRTKTLTRTRTPARRP
jgi:alpha-tubulin suppressor-like RCC1 family protein